MNYLVYICGTQNYGELFYGMVYRRESFVQKNFADDPKKTFAVVVYRNGISFCTRKSRLKLLKHIPGY